MYNGKDRDQEEALIEKIIIKGEVVKEDYQIKVKDF